MHLLITGATGFIGRHVVSAAIRHGHTVRVLTRSGTTFLPTSWKEHPNIEVFHADLGDAGAASECADGADAVAHLAVAKEETHGDPVETTLATTDNLLNAMERMVDPRIVLVSSFSVYEYLGRRSWDTLDETSHLCQHPEKRDVYCQTKLAQELRIREHAAEHEWPCVVLRHEMCFMNRPSYGSAGWVCK